MHKKRKHHPHTLKDLKPSVVTFVKPLQVPDTSNNVSAGCSADLSCGEDQTESVTESDDSAVENLPQVIEKEFAVILLKLGHIFHIPAKGVDELLEELHFC